jgi:hypothetical protein
MAKANTTWKVLPHQPIEELGENLMRVEGDLEGMPLKRVMTIAKRADGGLVVHNGIALGDDAMKRVDAWGEVTAIVVPNGWHRLDARVYKDRYPEARVYCPAGSRKQVEQVVPVDGTYEQFPADEAVSFVTLDGVGAREGVMVVRSTAGTTLVLNDLVFNIEHGKGLGGLVVRYIMQSSGGPKVSRVTRWFVIKDAAAVRAHLLRLAETPGLVRVIVSHGRVIEGDAAAALRAAAATVG